MRSATVLPILACWTAVALLFTPQTYLAYRQSPAPLTWPVAFLATALLAYLWAALTPAAIWVGKRFPIERKHVAGRLLLHFAVSVVFALVHVILLGEANELLLRRYVPKVPPVPVAAIVVGLGATNVMFYWSIIAVGHALTYLRRYQERDLALVRAQLQSLRTQLHPHFLFNTLNAIAELIHQDVRRAEKTLTQLSDLLRIALHGEADHEVALRDEIEFLRRYIDIQQTLLQERLIVQWDIDDEALDAAVPSMILQPLVENAIRHGISPRESGGTIVIAARRVASSLLLKVEDDGVGLASHAEKREEKTGIGLANTRARLRHMFGEAHRFELREPASGTGVAVHITIPFREVAEPVR